MKKSVFISVLLFFILLIMSFTFLFSSGVSFTEPEVNYGSFDKRSQYIIYKNCFYELNTNINIENIDTAKGKFIGTVNKENDIYKWNSRDYYTELGGSMYGKVYEIKGISPDSLLLVEDEKGFVKVFFSYFNQYFTKGKDITEKVFNLSDNADYICYYPIVEEISTAPQESDLCLIKYEKQAEITSFFKALGEAEFIKITDFNNLPYGETICILNITDKNGVVYRLNLCEGGFIQGIFPFCFQKIDVDDFESFINYLKEK